MASTTRKTTAVQIVRSPRNPLSLTGLALTGFMASAPSPPALGGESRRGNAQQHHQHQNRCDGQSCHHDHSSIARKQKPARNRFPNLCSVQSLARPAETNHVLLHADDQRKEGHAFDQRRRDNHRGLDVAGHLGLPGHAFHGRSSRSCRCRSRRRGSRARRRPRHRPARRYWKPRQDAAAAAPPFGSSAFLSSAANAGIAIANTTRTNNAILANLNTELISSEMVFPACGSSALVRMDCHADKKCRQKREYIGLQEGHEQLQQGQARPSPRRSPSVIPNQARKVVCRRRQ